MRKILVVLLLSGCASYSGSGLQPGKATEAEVRKVMGEPTTVRKSPDGGQTLWYSKLPAGRESYAARLDPQGRLVSIEQRITNDHIAKLVPGVSNAENVLDTLGPPYRVFELARIERKAWEYQKHGTVYPETVYVQLSPDNVVREVVQVDESGRSGLFFGFGVGIGF